MDADLMTMNVENAWSMFKNLISSSESETYRKVRFGIKIKFDINEYFRDNIFMKNKVGMAITREGNYDISDFHSELDKREKVMKKWLHQNIKDESIYGAWGEE